MLDTIPPFVFQGLSIILLIAFIIAVACIISLTSNLATTKEDLKQKEDENKTLNLQLESTKNAQSTTNESISAKLQDMQSILHSVGVLVNPPHAQLLDAEKSDEDSQIFELEEELKEEPLIDESTLDELDHDIKEFESSESVEISEESLTEKSVEETPEEVSDVETVEEIEESTKTETK